MGTTEYFDKLNIEAGEHAVTETNKDYFNLPSSPASDAIFRILDSHGDLNGMKNRIEHVSHGQTVKIGEHDEERNVIFETKKSETTLQVPDIALITGALTNKGVKKMLVFILMKINEQAYSGGAFRRDYIQFPLQELIDLGVYATPQSARVGFDNALNMLTIFKLKGKLYKGSKKIIEQSAVEVLFTGGRRRRGVCTVYLNPRVNWELIAAFYMIMPQAYFHLSNRASDLLYYLFYLARINMKAIFDRGYFTVSLNAIHARLNLIQPELSRNPSRDALTPILDAVDEIQTFCGSGDFTIQEVFNKEDSVIDIINSGYLIVTFCGAFAEYFKDIASKATQKIEARQKKQDAIVEKAKTAALASTIQKEQSMLQKEHCLLQDDV